MRKYYLLKKKYKYSSNKFNNFSVIPPEDESRKKFTKIFEQMGDKKYDPHSL